MYSIPDKAVKASSTSILGWKSWPFKRRLIILGLGLIAIFALTLGLGIGLVVGSGHGSGDENDSEPSPLPPPPPSSGNETAQPNATVKWQPMVGTTWQIELEYPLNDTSYNASIYDIDLFNNNASIIAELHRLGRKVICYFSAGSYENWRPDKDEFQQSDLGNTLDGWPDEKWVNISSSDVRRIMLNRLELAASKGCDGVDPDNVDGYDNDNGLGLTEVDSVDYVNWLAEEAHARNMSVGLKNAGDIIPSVLGNMQWSVNEQCVEFDECVIYSAFTRVGKPVFHIEYPKGEDTDNNQSVSAQKKLEFCDYPGVGNFSTVLKNMDLDNWVETC
ncbi:hypothetical protein MPDQ_005205 [Monascus purpureus]|uniref:alpha-galactosidase n=1 Tax=Monascus purpureus TaxID=5098 RepID=A0A507R086_MONPU|nr:hypothetical protein MPDQ_005205 [Monascus purpureus]